MKNVEYIHRKIVSGSPGWEVRLPHGKYQHFPDAEGGKRRQLMQARAWRDANIDPPAAAPKLTLTPRGANFDLTVRRAKELGAKVEPKRRTGETRFEHPLAGRCVVNGRRKDTSRALTGWLQRLERRVGALKGAVKLQGESR